MIGKISKGSSFSGLLDYLFKPKEKERPEREPDRENERAQQKSKEQELEQALNGRERVETDRAGPEQADKEKAKDEKTKEQPREPPVNDREKESRGKIIAGNMAGRNARELLHEFEALSSLKPEVERKVFHCALGIPKEDKVSPSDKTRIAEKFAVEMGLDNTMWTAIEHDEHEHKEIHFVASLIDYDGKTISDSKDYERAEEVIRRTEEEFGLKRVEPSREAMRRSPTQEEMKYFERTGVLSTRVRLQEHIDAAIGHGATASEMIEKLEARDVHIIPYLGKTGEVQGISYRLDGKVMKGSNLGRGYSWPGLQKDWTKHQELRQGKVTYEYERDYAAISRARSREDERRLATTVREQGTDERTISAIIRAPEKDSGPLGPHRKELDLTAAERGGVHQADLSAHGSHRQEVRRDRAEASKPGRGDEAARKLSGWDPRGNGGGHSAPQKRDGGPHQPDRGQDSQRFPRVQGTDTYGLTENTACREDVQRSAEELQHDDTGVRRDLSDDQYDYRGDGRDSKDSSHRSQEHVRQDDRGIESEIRRDIHTAEHQIVESSNRDSSRTDLHEFDTQRFNELGGRPPDERTDDSTSHRAVHTDHPGESRPGDQEDRGADQGLRPDLPGERELGVLPLHSSGQPARQLSLEDPAGGNRAETEDRLEYEERDAITLHNNIQQAEIITPRQVVESAALERLQQLTGIESSAQEMTLERLEKLTGANSPEQARTIEQLLHSGNTEQTHMDAARESGLTKGQSEHEELAEVRHDREGIDVSYDNSTPAHEHTREIEQTQEHEVVREIEHDFSMDR